MGADASGTGGKRPAEPTESLSATSMDPRVGRVLQDRYRIIERLGVGGMGQVYRGERIGLGRPVAVKFLHSMFAESDDAVRRFEREARAMSRMSHPNCISVIDVGCDDSPYIVMDYVTGRSLAEDLDGEPVPPKRAIHIIRQVLAALAHAHAQGVVHRDIKPENIMLTNSEGAEDHVLVVDFGLARFQDASISQDITAAQIIVGTPGYMSPEQSAGDQASASSDLYAVGITLFELLTGERPFVAESAWEVLQMHREEPVPKLRSRAPQASFSTELEALIAGALAKEPSKRYRSASEFADALARVPEARPTRAAPQQVSRPSRRRAFAVIGAAAAAAVAVVAVLISQGKSGTAATGATPAAKNRSATKSSKPAAAPEHPPAADAATAIATVPDASAIATVPDATATVPDATATVPDAAAPAPDPDAAPATATATVPDAAPATSTVADAATAPAPDAAPAGMAVAEPAPSRPAPKPMTLGQIRGLIRKGQRDRALAALIELRKKHPRDPYLPYLMGNLWAQKRWYPNAIKYYRIAIARKPSYKRNRVVIANTIKALTSNDRRSRASASKMLRYTIKHPAIPALRRVARKGRTRSLRKYAVWLIRRIQARPARKRRR